MRPIVEADDGFIVKCSFDGVSEREYCCVLVPCLEDDGRNNGDEDDQSMFVDPPNNPRERSRESVGITDEN